MSSAADDRGERLPLLTGLLLFTPVALIGNAAGSLFQFPEVGAAILFLPYAAMTAVLVTSPRRHWIWYLLAGSAAHFAAHWPQWPLAWVLLADLANVARALVAAILLRRVFGGPPRLDDIRSLLMFSVCASFMAPAVGATIGAANVIANGAAEAYWRTWLVWFASNALTALAMLPAFVGLFEFAGSWRRARLPRARIAEAALLAVTLAITFAVGLRLGTQFKFFSLSLYAPLPILIWAALRFGATGASFGLTISSFVGVWALDRGEGPFADGSAADNALALQVFIGVRCLAVLCLAAIGASRQRTSQLYRTLLASLEDHVAILDTRGVVLEVNDSWRRFQSTPGALTFHRVDVGDSYVEACRSVGALDKLPAGVFLDGVTAVLRRDRRRYEVEYSHDFNGKRRWFVVTFQALERPDGGAVVIRSDVTARRQAQLEIEEQRREVSHLSRVVVLGQLSGAIAHELNQPLSAILNNAEAGRRLLRQRPADLDELELILRDIAEEDQRAAAVIQRLRALFKREGQRLQQIHARDLITEVLQLAHSELIARHITTSTAIEPGLRPFPGDKVQLQQVMLNLILNACEAMSSVSAADRRLILTAGTNGDGHIHIATRDFGSGIPPALAERLFEPFVTTKPDGLGLGLSVSRTIVTAHGGRLWAETHADGGTTMHSVFPLDGPSAGQFAQN